jgi:hypothetical protein
MKRPTILIVGAVLVAGAVLVVAFGGVAGSAAVSNPLPDKQSLARHILDPRVKAYMTPATRAAFRTIADGGGLPAPANGSDLNLKATLGQGGAAPPAPSFTNVRVNNPATDSNRTDQTTQSETSVAVAGSNVVVGYNDSQHALFRASAGFDTIGYAYSTDGGGHFTDGDVVPNAPEFVNLADPWLASDRAGNVYSSFIMEDFFYGNDVIGVAKSTDGGKTFRPPVPTTRPTDFIYLSDKDAMAAGPDPNVKSRDDVYVAWDDFKITSVDFTLGLAFARSTDGGATWDVTDVARNPLPFDCSLTQYFGAQVGVDQKSGTVYVAAEKTSKTDPDCTGGTIQLSEVIFRSTDGGKTFGPETKIADITQATPNRFLELAPGQIMRTTEAPSLAVDGNNLYVAWNDGTTGKSHIRLATSTDGGATWSVAAATQGTNDEVQPAVSVDSKGIHLIYYRRNPDNTLDVFLQNSRSSGGWDTLRVTSQSFPGTITVPNFDPWADAGYMGDYIANVSDGSHQYFAWGDNRDRVTNFLWPTGRADPNVYFAKQ